MERTVFSVVPKLRLPTKMFFNLKLLSEFAEQQTGKIKQDRLFDRTMWERAQ
jgi:hypothetical protein